MWQMIVLMRCVVGVADVGRGGHSVEDRLEHGDVLNASHVDEMVLVLGCVVVVVGCVVVESMQAATKEEILRSRERSSNNNNNNFNNSNNNLNKKGVKYLRLDIQ